MDIIHPGQFDDADEDDECEQNGVKKDAGLR